MSNGLELLKNLFKKKKIVYIYENFDTDEDEDLELVPEWLRNRIVHKSELEKCIKMNKNIVKIPILRGSLRSEKISKIDQTQSEICMFKCIVLRNEDMPKLFQKIDKI